MEEGAVNTQMIKKASACMMTPFGLLPPLYCPQIAGWGGGGEVCRNGKKWKPFQCGNPLQEILARFHSLFRLVEREKPKSVLGPNSGSTHTGNTRQINPPHQSGDVPSKSPEPPLKRGGLGADPSWGIEEKPTRTHPFWGGGAQIPC